MSRRLVEIAPGTVLAIPLFTSHEPALTRFRAASFEGRGAEFAFCRVIADMYGSGFLIEVFDLVGSLDTELQTITTARRLFDPVAFSGLAVHKRRWRSIGVTPGYEPERDSRLSDVRLVLGADDDLRVWHGGTGTETPVGPQDAQAYERWTIWDAARLETRILDAMPQR